MTTSIVLLIVGWTAGWWLLWRVPTVRRPLAPALDRVVADVAVIIPARNEAAVLGDLLRSLAAQDTPAREVVVVDDNSTDGTADVAREHGATVIPGLALAPGWTGKSWACHQGAESTSSRVLVFLDADVRFERHALRALVDEHEARGGLVSVAPYHRMVGLVERLSAPFNLVAFMGVGAARPGRNGRSDGVFGPCLICRRSDYDAIGGHAAVRAIVTEDLALARAFVDKGFPTYALAGGGIVEYRMYPAGWRQLVEGWSKNVASGARFVPPLRSLLVALWITALLVATQYAVLAIWSPTRLRIGVAATAFIALAVQQRVRLVALTNAGWVTAALFPMTTLVFVALFVRSVWWTYVRRRVRWRGRSIDVAPKHGELDAHPEV
jgi:4,4'-diaponeurosporenoate glycosyltransferase